MLLHTALRKGRRDGMPRAEATTAKARAVVFLTYSSMLSISGLIVEIMVARPAACKRTQVVIRKPEMIKHFDDKAART